MAQLNTARNELETAWQRLALRWEESGQVWDDPVRWEFEQRYWTPLEAETRATMKEVDKLVQVIAQAQRSVR